jgi:transcriptional regulator with XRE-family HTH domain
LHDVFATLRTEIIRSKLSVGTIAQRAECSPRTIALWLDGAIKSPRITTLAAVARALDKRLVIDDGAVAVEEMSPPPPARPRRARMALWRFQ